MTMAEVSQINAKDWDRLSPEARAFLRTLAGLRWGRTVSELADRLQQTVDAVVDHITVDDNGKVAGPKGSVTLTIKVRPNPDDSNGSTVIVDEEIKNTYPQDRSHVLYVGRGGSLHTTDRNREDMLFEIRAAAEGGPATVEPTLFSDGAPAGDEGVGRSGRDAAAGRD